MPFATLQLQPLVLLPDWNPLDGREMCGKGRFPAWEGRGKGICIIEKYYTIILLTTYMIPVEFPSVVYTQMYFWLKE